MILSFTKTAQLQAFSQTLLWSSLTNYTTTDRFSKNMSIFWIMVLDLTETTQLQAFSKTLLRAYQSNYRTTGQFKKNIAIVLLNDDIFY